jgi:hypothetical protein
MTFCAKVEACLPSIITLLLNCSSPSPRRVAAPSIAVSPLRLRRSVMPLRTYAHPKPSARTWRLGMSASTAAKSNACTKPKTIRCVSLSDRAPARTFATTLMGPPPAANLRETTPTPGFQNTAKAAVAPFDLGALCERALNPARPFVKRAQDLAGLWLRGLPQLLWLCVTHNPYQPHQPKLARRRSSAGVLV